MKKYQNVKLVAKNAPKGSFVAGCSSREKGYKDPLNNCEYCKIYY